MLVYISDHVIPCVICLLGVIWVGFQPVVGKEVPISLLSGFFQVTPMCGIILVMWVWDWVVSCPFGSPACFVQRFSPDSTTVLEGIVWRRTWCHHVWSVWAGAVWQAHGLSWRLPRCQCSSCEEHALGLVLPRSLMCSDVFEENTQWEW